MVNFKMYDVTDCTAIHTWPNISKNKGNQTKKFGQLIQHNMRNTFLKNQAKNCGEDSPRP